MMKVSLSSNMLIVNIFFTSCLVAITAEIVAGSQLVPASGGSTGGSKCLFRNECAVKENLLGEVSVPCVEPHDPHKLGDEEALVTLRNVCPEFFKDGEEDPDLCCDPDQVYAMEQNFQVPMTLGLGRCPSCSYNWRVNFCELTCSPRQSEFIKIVNSTVLEDGRIQLDAAEYHVSSTYSDALLASCQGVQGLSTGQTLLDVMCGGWGSSKCTAQRWLDFLGTSVENSGQSPFQLYYKIHNGEEGNGEEGNGETDGIIPMNAGTYKCSEVPFGSNKACACVDCEETCRAKPLPEEARHLPSSPDPVTINGMSGAMFASLFIFVICNITILTYFGMKTYNKKRTRSGQYSSLSFITLFLS